MDRLRRHLAALALLAAFFGTFAATAHAQVTRTRAIILSFEGWNSEQARAAIESGLNAAYDMITEQQAVDTAMQIGVDPSTPEGLGAVVARLHIELVIGGSVSGHGSRATTSIWVTDTQGNQLATRTGGAPTGRGFQGELTTAALQACADAVMALHPPGSVRATPPPTGSRTVPDETTTAPPPDEDPTPQPPPEPEYDDSYDIDHEVAGHPRGQRSGGPSSRSGASSGSHDADPTRWNQPIFRGLVGIDVRNYSASTSGGTGANPSFVDSLPVPFFPALAFWLELRPFAQNNDALRGLYGYVNAQFSVGQSYFRVDDTAANPRQRNLNIYGLDFGVGYAGTINEVVELIGTIGAGLDGLTLVDPVATPPTGCNPALPARPDPVRCAATRDFPSIEAWYLRPDIQRRVRLVQDLLIAEGAFGGRIVLNGFGDAGSSTPNLANTDFGAPSGGGIDFSLGLAGIIDPGFAWRARFGYSGNYVSFGDPGGPFRGDLCTHGWCRDSGTIEAWHIHLGIGWAFR